MARKYYTLAVRTPNELFTPEFGDYDRAVVAAEMADMKAAHDAIKGTAYKIVTTSPKQADITRAVAALNGMVD